MSIQEIIPPNNWYKSQSDFTSKHFSKWAHQFPHSIAVTTANHRFYLPAIWNILTVSKQANLCAQSLNADLRALCDTGIAGLGPLQLLV